MKSLDIWGMAALYITLAGAINWGLIGLLRLNLIGLLLGGDFSILARLVYIIIGAAAGYFIYLNWFKKEPA